MRKLGEGIVYYQEALVKYRCERRGRGEGMILEEVIRTDSSYNGETRDRFRGELSERLGKYNPKGRVVVNFLSKK